MIRRMVGAMRAAAVMALAGIALWGGEAMAATGMGVNGQLGMQPAASPIAEQIHQFHDLVNGIIIAIAIFVLILMVYVMVRFNAKANPTPSRTTHNTLLEVAWTVLPIIILVIIALPSFNLLRAQYTYPKPDLTIKATAYQWYWTHEYLAANKDDKAFSFDSATWAIARVRVGRRALAFSNPVTASGARAPVASRSCPAWSPVKP